MKTTINQPSRNRLLKWFNPVGRQTGGLAFILNRITALGLTFYLFLHLIVLGKLASGPDAYNSFIAMVKSPLFIFGELFVVAGVFLHGFNGVRIFLTSFGIAPTRQKQLFYVLISLAVLVIIYFGVHMFTA